MIKITVTTIIIITLAYVGICGLLFAMQRRLLYFPTVSVDSDLAEARQLANGSETLKVWHISGNGDEALIYFGGNAEDVAENIPVFARLFPRHHIHMMNYRGFGGSSGTPTEHGLFGDALTLYDQVAQDHQRISVIGRSLGTGVAMHVAAERNVERLVLVTPYDSMINIASSLYPFAPVSLLLLDKYDSLSRAKSIEARTLILIAEHDEVIARERTDNLSMALPQHLTTIELIPATDHNSICVSPAYERAMSAFLNHSPASSSQ